MSTANNRGWFSVLSLLIITVFTPLWSEQVSSIIIDGPKRTREETLLSIIGVKPGDEIDGDFLEKVEQRLRKSGLFQEEMNLSLVKGGGGTELHITVYDRWTLLGFPLFAASGDSWSAGLFFIDSNLGGRGNLLLSSVMYGSEGNLYAFGVFRNPSFLESDFSFATRLSGGRNRTRITDLAEKEIRADFVADSVVLGFGTGKQTGDRLDWRVFLEGEYREIGEAAVFSDEIPDGGGSLNLEGQLSFDDQKVSSIFLRGIKTSARAKTFWAPGDLPDLNLTGEIQGAWTEGERISLSATARGGFSRADLFHTLRLGGAGGSLTLPSRKIAASLYGNGELKGELRLAKLNFAVLTAPVFYEAGFFRDSRDESLSYHGMGAGFRFYIDKVAIPALGLDYRFNFTTGAGGVNFFIGMSY